LKRTVLTIISFFLVFNLFSQEKPDKMDWWREAKFGMFIHWGIYSVPAGYYHGQPVPRTGEWIMNHGKIPMAEYQQFAKEFNPTGFNVDQWVKIAKDAGMKYIVITAKHHDGFAMWPSKASKWNIYDATPWHHDPLQELAVACRNYGIRLGFYYSQAQDWNNGGAASGGKWDPAQKHGMNDYIDKIAVPQVKELLTNYGSDVPAVLWWDTPGREPNPNINHEQAQKLYDTVEKLLPGIIMNNRLGGGYEGDTEKDKAGKPKFITAWNWRCTTRSGKLYVMIFNWPADGKFELPGLESKVTKAFLLDDNKAVEFSQTDVGVTLDLPSVVPDKIASVVCVEIADAVAKVAPLAKEKSH